MIALLLAQVATAASVQVKICAQVVNNFEDSIVDPPLQYVLDDFLNDNTVARPLRGVRIKVSALGAGGSGTFSADSGPDAGCATFFLDEQKVWTVSVESKGVVNGNNLNLYDDADTPQPYVHVFHLPIYPQFGTTYTRTIHVGTTPEWDIYTAASWALHHRDLGFQDETFTMYNAPCHADTGKGQCYKPQLDAIFVNTHLRNNTAHEMGHYLLYRKLGHGAESDLTADNFTCNSNAAADDPSDPYDDPPLHEMQQREFAAGAFWEGWANFYATLTFNNKNHADCFFESYKTPDWDLDGDQEPRTTNIVGVPWEDAAGNPLESADLNGFDARVGTRDYLWYSHVDAGCAAGATMDNRATELDYVRFFWEMYSEHGMSVSEIADVISLADSDSFYRGADPELDRFDPNTDISSWPSVRLQYAGHLYDAAHGTNWGFTWAFAMADHGLSR